MTTSTELFLVSEGEGTTINHHGRPRYHLQKLLIFNQLINISRDVKEAFKDLSEEEVSIMKFRGKFTKHKHIKTLHKFLFIFCN